MPVPERLESSTDQVNLPVEPSTSQASQQHPTFHLRSRTAAINDQADIYEVFVTFYFTSTRTYVCELLSF